MTLRAGLPFQCAALKFTIFAILGGPQSLHLNRSGELGGGTDAQRLADTFLLEIS